MAVVRNYYVESIPNDCSELFMKKERWNKVKDIVDSAISIGNPQKRREFIGEVCDSDRLLQEVTDLIRCIEKAEEERFLE